mmetsp:Transcript_8801/g.13516  ORF Transcript_8801/g.13516 Transcript_8801/m.13516 type:complete len:92 (+) Transcript_8801:1-276(+)
MGLGPPPPKKKKMKKKGRVRQEKSWCSPLSFCRALLSSLGAQASWGGGEGGCSYVLLVHVFSLSFSTIIVNEVLIMAIATTSLFAAFGRFD